MTDSRTRNITIADGTEISRHGVLNREERLILAYRLAGLLHRLGIDAGVLDECEIDRLIEKLECGNETPRRPVRAPPQLS